MRRILVLAQTPPPEHGQSRMVAEALRALRADGGWGVSHVNLAVSAHTEEIGGMGPRKLARLGAVGWRCLWTVLRERPEVLYYVPAPPKPSAIGRDALLLTWLRRLVPHTVYHWHASGLGAWAATAGTKGRWVQRLHRGAALSLVLDPTLADDAAVFAPRRTAVLPNGCADPWHDPSALTAALAARRARRADPRHCPHLLFMARLEVDKGLFATLAGVGQWCRDAGRGAVLQVAGEFPDAATRAAWAQAVAGECAATPGLEVRLLGFVDGAAKHALFAASDALLLPTRYPYEAQPLVVVEALAHGLPVAATRWRGLPFILPEGTTSWIAEERRAPQVAAALEAALHDDGLEALRSRFVDRFSLDRWRAQLLHELAGVGRD